MPSQLLQKIKNFLRADIRWKLKKISSVTKIKFYLDHFPFTGLKGIYTRFIFNLLFFEKALVKRKLILENIKRNTTVQKNEKINFFVSSPGSGSNYLRCMLSSYFEIFYKIGNGIPKFDNIYNKWIYSASPIIEADLYNAVNLEKISLNNAQKRKDYSELFFSNEDFSKMKVVFTRHPFSNIDLFHLNNIRPVVLIREPLDWLISYYTHHKDRRYDMEKNINQKLIDEALNKIKRYFIFWKEYSIDKTKNKDFKIVNFDSLINNSEKEFYEICNFYNYKNIDSEIIKRCVEINSKEFALKYLKVQFKGSRFTDNKSKQQTIDAIKNFSIEQIEKKNIKTIFNNLVELS